MCLCGISQQSAPMTAFLDQHVTRVSDEEVGLRERALAEVRSWTRARTQRGKERLSQQRTAVPLGIPTPATRGRKRKAAGPGDQAQSSSQAVVGDDTDASQPAVDVDAASQGSVYDGGRSTRSPSPATTGGPTEESLYEPPSEMGPLLEGYASPGESDGLGSVGELDVVAPHGVHGGGEVDDDDEP